MVSAGDTDISLHIPPGGGGGGGILASQNWKVLKCQDLHEFQFSGVVVLGEGGCDQIPEQGKLAFLNQISNHSS